MRKNVLRTLVLTGIALLAMGGGAAAIVLRAGPIEVTAEGGFTPTTLPKHETAPITIHGEGKIGTTAGAIYFDSPLSLPYVLDQLVPALRDEP